MGGKGIKKIILSRNDVHVDIKVSFFCSVTKKSYKYTLNGYAFIKVIPGKGVRKLNLHSELKNCE